LTSMVANLTVGRRGQEDVWQEMDELAVRAQEHKDWLMRAVDADTLAFQAVLAARRLPKGSEEEITAREQAIVQANRQATLVPLEVLERTLPMLSLAQTAAEKGNPNSLSDAGVAALCSMSCAEGAYYNVLINLAGMAEDRSWATQARARARGALDRALAQGAAIQQTVRRRLEEELG
jgi:formiminotetrahydrofolate cyclodeaminase